MSILLKIPQRKKIVILNIVKIIVVLSAAAILFLIFCHKNNFTSLDLGRHIENGRIITHNINLLYSNYYSYTETNFPFICHHWLSGVIFYVLYLFGGLSALTILNFIIALLTIAIIFYCAYKRSNFLVSAVFILPVILILNERNNIRPEMFSYLLLAIVFFILDEWRRNKNIKLLYWLIPIQLLWINLHIYFFLGLFLISLALFEQILSSIFSKYPAMKVRGLLRREELFKSKNNFKFFIITALAYAVSLINPNFIKGFLYPFNILRQYGYDIVENKSPLYLESLMIDYNILLFKILVFILIISFIIFIWKKRKLDIFDFFISLFFTIIAFFAIRNLPIFALMVLPIIAGNFYALKPNFKKYRKYNLLFIIIILLIYFGTLSFLISDYKGERIFLKYNIGLGNEKGSSDSAKFFNDNNLSGPIFNNYDLGSALIFWLYPKEKVFVDNRPEAYSIDFFRKYKKMQDDKVWEELSKKYNINLIYFSHTDGTPWAREFLIKRFNDKNWPLIYFDRYVVIMAKNNGKNKEIIKKYKINSDKFIKKIKKMSKGASNGVLINLANLSQLNGQRDIAENIYSRILAKQPNNGKVLALQGYFYSSSRRADDISTALYYFDRAISAGYKLPGIYNQMGLCYWNLREYKKAKEMWKKSLYIDRDNDHAKYYLKQAISLGF